MYLRVVAAPAMAEVDMAEDDMAEDEDKEVEDKEDEDEAALAAKDKVAKEKEKEAKVDKLQHFCRNCGHTTDITTSVVFRQDGGTNTSFEPSNYLNELSKYDPTLPVAKISCPCAGANAGAGAGAGLKDAVYVRYDNSNMKYLFMCNTCNQYSLADKKANENGN